MTVDTYDIQELVKASGVPRRTIYFYVQQDILPPPEGAGLAAHYTDEHLLRLRLIPVFRQQGLRLDEIRTRFGQMNMAEMRQALAAQPLPGAGERPAAPGNGRSIADRPAGVVPPVLPGWGEQRYIHYALPAGILLAAPGSLNAADRQRLQLLLQAARQIFSTGTFYYQNTGQSNDVPPASPKGSITGDTSGDDGSFQPS